MTATLANRPRVPEKNSNWRGGISHHADGYIQVRAEGHPRAKRERSFRVFEHIIVAEHVLGRHLLPDEVVHHKNGDRTDNRPANLEVLTRAAHNRLHMTGRVFGPCPLARRQRISSTKRRRHLARVIGMDRPASECDLVFLAVRDHPDQTSSWIAELLGMPARRVASRMHDLRQRGLVEQTGTRRSNSAPFRQAASFTVVRHEEDDE